MADTYFVCPSCERICLSKEKLNRHLETCSKAGKMVASQDQVKRDGKKNTSAEVLVEDSHAESDDEMTPSYLRKEPNPKQYKHSTPKQAELTHVCTACSKKCSSLRGLGVHKKACVALQKSLTLKKQEGNDSSQSVEGSNKTNAFKSMEASAAKKKESQEPVKEFKVPCPACPRMCINKTGLILHMRSCQKYKATHTNKLGVVESDTAIVNCPTCGGFFQGDKGLRQHFKRSKTCKIPDKQVTDSEKSLSDKVSEKEISKNLMQDNESSPKRAENEKETLAAAADLSIESTSTVVASSKTKEEKVGDAGDALIEDTEHTITVKRKGSSSPTLSLKRFKPSKSAPNTPNESVAASSPPESSMSKKVKKHKFARKSTSMIRSHAQHSVLLKDPTEQTDTSQQPKKEVEEIVIDDDDDTEEKVEITPIDILNHYSSSPYPVDKEIHLQESPDRVPPKSRLEDSSPALPIPLLYTQPSSAGFTSSFPGPLPKIEPSVQSPILSDRQESASYRSSVPSPQLSKEMILQPGDFLCRFLGSQEFADCTILTDSADIPAHKIILASKYPQLTKHFYSSGVLDMSVIPYGQVSNWLKCLYTNSSQLDIHNVYLESISSIITQLSKESSVQSKSSNLSLASTLHQTPIGSGSRSYHQLKRHTTAAAGSPQVNSQNQSSNMVTSTPILVDHIPSDNPYKEPRVNTADISMIRKLPKQTPAIVNQNLLAHVKDRAGKSIFKPRQERLTINRPDYKTDLVSNTRPSTPNGRLVPGPVSANVTSLTHTHNSIPIDEVSHAQTSMISLTSISLKSLNKPPVQDGDILMSSDSEAELKKSSTPKGENSPQKTKNTLNEGPPDVLDNSFTSLKITNIVTGDAALLNSSPVISDSDDSSDKDLPSLINDTSTNSEPTAQSPSQKPVTSHDQVDNLEDFIHSWDSSMTSPQVQVIGASTPQAELAESLGEDDEIVNSTPVRRKKPTHRAYVPSPFTPAPDFQAMTDEQLKTKIRGYGLRDKMSRKRMIAALTQIYTELHQYETDTSAEWTILQSTRKTKQLRVAEIELPAKNMNKAKSAENNRKSVPVKNKSPTKVKHSESASNHPPTEHRSQDLSDIDKLLDEVDDLLQDKSDDPQQEGASDAADNSLLNTSSADKDIQSNSNTSSESDREGDGLEQGLNERLYSLIRNDRDMYNRVLKYQMIPLEELTAKIKAAGIKFTKPQLEYFYFTQCLPIQTKNEREQKKNRQKSPKKTAATGNDGKTKPKKQTKQRKAVTSQSREQEAASLTQGLNDAGAIEYNSI